MPVEIDNFPLDTLIVALAIMVAGFGLAVAIYERFHNK